MSEERWSIPQNWKWVHIREIAKIVGGGTPSSRNEANFTETGVAWITPADLTGYKEAYISRGRRDLSEEGYASSSATLVPKGTVLFSSRAPIGYCVIAQNEVSTNQGFKNLVLKDSIQPEFIRYYLLSSKDYAESKASGTTFLELSARSVGELMVPLAPYSEQKCIVEKISNLLTSSTRAQEELERIPILIEKYKARLLANAYSGTGAFTDLFNGKDFKQLDSICISVTDGDHQAPPRVDEGIPFITISNMSTGFINLQTVTRFVPQKYYDDLKETRRAQKDDVLFSVTGSIGIPALVSENVPFVFQRHIALIRPNSEKILSEYLYYILAAPQVMDDVLSVATGSAQLTLPLGKLRKLNIPLPSLSKQEQIVRHIKATFAWIDTIAVEHKAAVKLIAKLETAILSKAFRGELVSQDKDDESVNLLLERIQAEQDVGEVLSKSKKRIIRKKNEVNLMEKKLFDVLTDAEDWTPAQEAFRRCGVVKGTQTEQIEELYTELRELDRTGQLKTKDVYDKHGRKIYDLLKLIKA